MNALNLIRRPRNYLNNCPNHGICFGIKAIQLIFHGVGNTEVLTNKARLMASICLLVVVSVTSNAEAQKAEPSKRLKPQAVSETPERVLTKHQQEQIERIQSFLQSMEPKLMPILRKSKVFPQMQDDMKRIAASKNNDGRQKLTIEYQRRYREVYGSTWKKAGYKRSSVLAQVRRLAPDMNVQMIQDFGFLIAPRRLKEGDDNPPVNMAPRKSTEVLRLPFGQYYDTFRPFNLLASGSSDAGPGGVSVNIVTGGLGGASAYATMQTGFQVPEDIHAASLRLRGVSRVETFAGSLAGLAGTSMSTRIVVSEYSYDYDDYEEIYSIDVFSWSLAPLAWATYHTSGDESHDRQVELQLGKIYAIEVYALGSAAGYLVGASGGGAQFSGINVERTYLH